MTIQIKAIRGLYANANDNTLLKVISKYDLVKSNNWFEFTESNKPTHPFLDIDNHNDYKGTSIEMNETEFNQLVLRIEKNIVNRFPELPLLNASKYNSEKYKPNGDFDKNEHKISFRLTDHTKLCNDMKTCKDYCLNVLSKQLKECLGNDAQYIDVDPSVYRNGKGKMSCINSYKYPQEKDRTRKLVNGELEHTFIQGIHGDEEKVEFSKPTIIPQKKQKKEVKQVSPKPLLEPLDDKLVNRFYDYAFLIDKKELGDREKWLKFTLLHINILGINDWDNYNNFLKDTTGYNEYENKMTYETLHNNKDKTQQKLGWKYLYQIAYDNNKEEKLKLDIHYREPFNVFTMLKKKPKVEDNDIQKQIDELEDNEDLKTSVKKRKIKELEKQLKEHNKNQAEAKYKAMKSYFELYHFKINFPFNYATTVNTDEVVMRYNKNSFRDYCDNIEINDGEPFTSKWFKDPKIKTYDTMDFIPYGVKCPDNVFNMFSGLEIEKVRSKDTHSFDYILETIKLNAGDNDDMYEYLVNYLAHLVQKPGILPQVSIVVVGEQGTGKSSLWENLGDKLLGKRYSLQSSNADDIIGKFNINKNKLLVVMEETEAKNTFESCSQIKTLITQPTKYFENKGKDKFNVRNCGRYIFISNSQTPVKIEQSDRRFVVTECSNRHIQDRAFFNKVNEEWNDPLAVRGFYDFLMKKDISNYDPVHDRVISEVYEDMKSVSIPTIARWLENKYYTYNNQLESENPTWASLLKTRKATELFKSYKKWMEKSGYKTDGINPTRFGRDIKRYKGIEVTRTNKGVIYDLCYEAILKGLIERGYTKEIEKTIDVDIEKEEDYYSD